MERELLGYLGFKPLDLNFLFSWLKESGITLEEVFEIDLEIEDINEVICSMFYISETKIIEQIKRYYNNTIQNDFQIYVNYLDSHLTIGDVEITPDMVKELSKEDAKEILIASGLYEDELEEV